MVIYGEEYEVVSRIVKVVMKDTPLCLPRSNYNMLQPVRQDWSSVLQTEPTQTREKRDTTKSWTEQSFGIFKYVPGKVSQSSMFTGKLPLLLFVLLDFSLNLSKFTNIFAYLKIIIYFSWLDNLSVADSKHAVWLIILIRVDHKLVHHYYFYWQIEFLTESSNSSVVVIFRHF